MADHMAERDARTRVPRARVDAAPTPAEGFQNFRAPASDHDAPQQAAGSSSDPQKEDPKAAGAPVARARESVRSWLHATFPGHENAVVWGFVGFLVALLFFIIGFWRTLVVVLLVLVGVAFGQVLDGDPKIINTLRGLFGGDDAR